MSRHAQPPLADLAVRLCREMLGLDTDVVGSADRRNAVRLQSRRGDLIVTRRDTAERAQLEGEVLRALHRRGAPVPRMFCYRGRLLVQEDLGSPRLSQSLAASRDIAGYLDAALVSLARIHRAGRAAGLDRKIASIGRRRDWRLELASMPGRISARLGLEAPMLDPNALAERLRVRQPVLIKWDARPGNAVARGPDSVVSWFDWEHCGVRDRLDDVAWLMVDEYVPDDPETETALLRDHIAEFAGGRDRADASDYLATFGALHICVRLGLVLHFKGDGPWWDPVICLEKDKVGVSAERADGLAAKGARWAGRSRSAAGMAPWFEAVRTRLREL